MDQFIKTLETWVCATAWTIEEPPAYGAFHILFTLIGFALCFLLAWKLRHLRDKGNRILLFCVGLFLAVTEVYKQLFYFFYIQPYQYSWWIFPFQLCSAPMYLCLVAAFLRPGKLQQAMYDFMMLYNLLGGAISFAEPSGLLHPYLTLTAHALLWHMLLVFVGLYLILSGRGKPGFSNYRNATKTFLYLCMIAFCINLLFRDVSNGSINMFFVGPSNSSIVVFKQISEAFGWYVSTALYIPAVCLGTYLLLLIIRYFQKRSCRLS